MRAILREKNDEIENLETMVLASRPHLHRDWAHPATSAPGLGSPLPHLHRDRGSPPPTSAPGLGPPLAATSAPGLVVAQVMRLTSAANEERALRSELASRSQVR